MPLREYFCTKCGKPFELLTRSKADDDRYRKFAPCPNCTYLANALPPKTAPPQFNGPGFYQTDYK